MASLCFLASPLPPTRWKTNWPIYVTSNFLILKDFRYVRKLQQRVAAQRSAKTGSQNATDDGSISVDKETTKTSKRAPRKSRKKASEVAVDDNAAEVYSDSEAGEGIIVMTTTDNSKTTSRRGRRKVDNNVPEVQSDAEVGKIMTVAATTSDDSKKTSKRGRRKGTASSSNLEEDKSVKKTTRRGRSGKKVNGIDDQSGSEIVSDNEQLNLTERPEDNRSDEVDLNKYEEEDISFTYSWPPLVCCFGAAQLAFIPSGKPANRLIDYEIHESKKDMLWSPDKFVRAPGGPSSDVAIALAKLGGRVAFMGKLGDDDFGQTMLYHLNVNNVQTRSIKVDKSKFTALSYMKVPKRGGLKVVPTKPCAEDCLLSSDINVNVLKEAKIFYFNSSSLLDSSMRSTTLRAIEVSKTFGGSVFFDLNLPIPLWEASDVTKNVINEAWKCADFIEVTKQELEFLCGIEPSENFDTEDNDKLKFVHYKPEVVRSLWHKNLKVLFVTNGTSKIHFYTEKDHGFIRGTEDAPITPFTCDMSASGDAIVAALMRMLTVQPHLATDKGYLQHMIKYASNCGVIDQWIQGRVRGFPPKEEVDPEGVRSITEKQYRTLEPVLQ